MSKQQPGTHPDPETMAAMIDGNLGHEERAAMVHHLAECEECREALAEYARADGLARADAARSRAVWLWMPVAATVMLATIAGVLVMRRQPPETTAPPATAPPDPVPSNPVPSNPVPPAPAPQAPSSSVPSAPSPPPPEDLTTRRSGARAIRGKLFRLIAGEWVDTTYDPLALLPVENVPPDGRDAAVAKVPALEPYLVLGPRFVVVHDGIVYRFAPR